MKNRLLHTLPRKVSLLTFILLICLATPGFAMDVTLEWDANTETDRAGYRIYYDTDSGAPYENTGALGGDSPIDVKIADVEVGNTARYTVTGLNDNETYFFTITAYNTSGGESGYSSEVSTADDINTNNASSGKGGGGCFITILNP